MDYRKLLKKYINYVGEMEGVTFLSDFYGTPNEEDFTREEWKELQELDKES